MEYIKFGAINKNDLKKLRYKLNMTQTEFANLVNVSKKTIERWETSDKEITGPMTTLYQILNNNIQLMEAFEIPEQEYPLRLKYYFRKQLCTIIDVDERNRLVRIKNYQNELIYRAFGKISQPTFEQYEEFLTSRCVPKQRDKMKLVLREIGVPFYEPMMIIEKTEGRMAEDEFWIKIVRDNL